MNDGIVRDDSKLTLRKCTEFEDWWCIEKKDAREFGELRGYDIGGYGGVGLWLESRLGDGFADIEGTAIEMRGLADAIEEKRHQTYKRCGAEWTEDGVFLWSPRNSLTRVLVTHENAIYLVSEIRKKVTP